MAFAGIENLYRHTEIQAALGRLGGSTATNGSIAASALSSAVAQAARQNTESVRRNYAVYLEKKATLSGAILAALQNAENHAMGVIQRHLARTAEEQAQYAVGQQGAEEAHVRYREYTDIAPDESQIYTQAASQAIDDITSGDPFRSAREQGFSVGGVFRNIRYALTGDNPQPVRNEGECPLTDISCHLSKTLNRVVIIFAVVAIVGLTYKLLTRD